MDIINTIFRCIDCFVVVSLVVYAIKKYLIPAVEKSVREYGVFIYNLESDCKNLQLQIQSISENMQDQDRHAQVLQRNFALWQKKCQERKFAFYVEHEKNDEQMHKRYEIRSECVKREKVLQDQAPYILQDVTKMLQAKYQNQHIQKQYIDELIASMKVKS